MYGDLKAFHSKCRLPRTDEPQFNLKIKYSRMLWKECNTPTRQILRARCFKEQNEEREQKAALAQRGREEAFAAVLEEHGVPCTSARFGCPRMFVAKGTEGHSQTHPCVECGKEACPDQCSFENVGASNKVYCFSCFLVEKGVPEGGFCLNYGETMQQAADNRIRWTSEAKQQAAEKTAAAAAKQHIAERSRDVADRNDQKMPVASSSSSSSSSSTSYVNVDHVVEPDGFNQKFYRLRDLTSVSETEEAAEGPIKFRNFCCFCVKLKNLAPSTQSKRKVKYSFGNPSNLVVHMDKRSDYRHYALVKAHKEQKIAEWLKLQKVVAAREEAEKLATPRDGTITDFFGGSGGKKSYTQSHNLRRQKKRAREKKQREKTEFSEDQKINSRIAWALMSATEDVPNNLGEKKIFHRWQLASIGIDDSDEEQEEQPEIMRPPTSRVNGKYQKIIAQQTKKNMAKEMCQDMLANVLKSLHIAFDLYKDNRRSNQVRGCDCQYMEYVEVECC